MEFWELFRGYTSVGLLSWLGSPAVLGYCWLLIVVCQAVSYKETEKKNLDIPPVKIKLAPRNLRFLLSRK